jgi:predicted acyltransferase
MSATLTATGTLLNEQANQKTISAPRRVLSIDLLRGLTIALMILVNDPGDWNHLFRQLDHAEWNGWTLTDLVFPTFLFLVGTSMVYSLASRAAKGNCRGTLTGHIFARTGKLLLLAFLLNFFPRMHWAMRFYGVIPRIAICSLIAGLLLIATMKVRRQAVVIAGIVAALLLGYWILLRWVPVPGAGMPVRDVPLLDEVRNLTAWIDRGFVGWTRHWLHTGYLYRKTSDPEGLLSTLPAVATVLIGALVGMWMRRPEWLQGYRSRAGMRNGLLVMGAALFLAGAIWGRSFPINKNLWTSSFVLLTAGIATLALALLNWLVDDRPQPWPMWLRVITWPWFVFGSNAMAAYTTSVVLVKAALYFKVGAAKTSLWSVAYFGIFARHESTVWTSLAFAIAFVAVCFLPNWWLWHKKWFWKM